MDPDQKASQALGEVSPNYSAKIARIRWFHKVTNYEVLACCNLSSLQSMIDKANLRWTGHVVRMKDHSIPKALLYGRLATGAPKRGNLHKQCENHTA